jgi:tRNA (cmo5U34)-methyltransferase
MKQSDNTTPYNAREYDNNVRKTIPFYELFHAETIDLVKLLKPQAKSWLDTGCGTGYLVERAFAHFPYTFFVLADPSESMLIEAKKRLQRIGTKQVRFIDCAGSEDLPAKLNIQPEVITAIMCHHYLKPQKRYDATAACFNLLAPQGLYITFENIRPHSREATEAGWERWKRFQMSQGRSVSAVEEHLKRFDKEYFPITIDEHLDLLKKCGFHIAELFWYSQMQAGFYAIK